eukprot:TRINITY_DN74915_c0_g1_i1.p1 TRINITY_DN74915_c0_g1~~TRINITY_DN74915_c0_g1_i1.p1  ORF type:complete len:119 (-),score=3.04 TRINITY_DN74915_c0_g1_i1:34-390(-)
MVFVVDVVAPLPALWRGVEAMAKEPDPLPSGGCCCSCDCCSAPREEGAYAMPVPCTTKTGGVGVAPRGTRTGQPGGGECLCDPPHKRALSLSLARWPSSCAVTVQLVRYRPGQTPQTV